MGYWGIVNNNVCMTSFRHTKKSATKFFVVLRQTVCYKLYLTDDHIKLIEILKNIEQTSTIFSENCVCATVG